nr:hypothetical protein [Rickettsia endosymbiont of Ceutorhynchus assimilis]
MILRSRVEIAQEKRLLNEVIYHVGNFKFIVGLSVARGMLPAVKIINSMLNLPEEQTCITLADFDWYEFLEKVSKMVNETDAAVKDSAEQEVSGQQALSENFTLYVISFFGEQTLTLKSGNCTLCFCLDDVKQILTVSHLINYRLKLVKNLNFIVYYDDYLQYLNVTHNNNNNLMQSIISMCNLNKCECSYYFLELASMNLDKIVRDLDKLNACIQFN